MAKIEISASRVVRQFRNVAAVHHAVELRGCTASPRTNRVVAPKNLEFIVPTAAGSSMDVLARLIQDLWQRNQLVTTSMTVQARPGGGRLLAWSYVSQRAGDRHYLAVRF